MKRDDLTDYKRAIDFQRTGKFRQADKYYRRALKKEMDNPHILFNFSGFLYQTGKFSEAVSMYSRLLDIRPDDYKVYFNMGMAMHSAGRIDVALIAFSKATSLEPGFSAAHINKIELLNKQEKLQSALASCKKALEYLPNCIEIWCQLGSIQRALKDLKGSAQSYDNVLLIDANNVVAIYGRALVFNDVGNYTDAIIYFNRAISLNPSNISLQTDLANTYLSIDDAESAIELFRCILAVDPDDCDARNNYACALHGTGRVSEARKMFESVQADNKNHLGNNINFLNLLVEQGDFELARNICKDALGTFPSEAYFYHVLANVKSFKDIDDDVRGMESLYAVSSSVSEQRILLCFSLGKVFEDLFDYDKAMRFYTEGNKLKRALVNVDFSFQRRLVDYRIKVFSTEFFARHKNHGSDSDAPIFIVGMPRSGTSLVEQILASHPSVVGAGERKDMDAVLRSVSGAGLKDVSSGDGVSFDLDLIKCMADDYLKSIEKIFDIRNYFTDKMPGNYIHIGMIHLLFPRAKIIHCVRDPVDTCLSCYKRLFSGGGLNFSYKQDDLAKHYCLYRELMVHWRRVLPGVIYDISYEALVANQVLETRQLLEYCGLPWDESCLKFHETSRSVSTHSTAQVRRPIYRSSIRLWKKYEHHLKPLIRGLNNCFRDVSDGSISRGTR